MKTEVQAELNLPEDIAGKQKSWDLSVGLSEARFKVLVLHTARLLGVVLGIEVN